MKNSGLLVNKLAIHSCAFASAVALCLVGLLVQTGQAATLTHRYSFDSDAGDSVGGADGVLQGNAYVTNGAMVLDGTNSSVQLPNNLFTDYDSISFELWFADGAITSPNAQLYAFSGTNGSMSYALNGVGTYILGFTNFSANVVGLPIPAVHGTVHLAWTQDSASHTACLYVNGILAGQNTNFTLTPSGIGSTTNNYIGGIGSISTVSNFQGSILEFRTYQGALSPLDAVMLDAFGPDLPQLNPGTLQAVRLVIPSPTGPGALFRAGVYADFANVSNVNISTQPDLVLSSDNTNAIVIASDQRLRTMALGTANITAAWQGFSNTVPVTVDVPQDVALVHRYSFNEQTNDWIVHDSMGVADGQFAATRDRLGSLPQISFTGGGELEMFNSNSVSSSKSYVALPAGLISSFSEVSIEAWINWTDPYRQQWERVFDFGSWAYSGPGDGGTYLFLTPNGYSHLPFNGNGLHSTISTNDINFENPSLTWTNNLPTNVMSFVAVTYSSVRGVMKMYLNGVPVASGTAVFPLSAIIDTSNWLGRSQFSTDPYFDGYYDEFRIYSGLLSDADVAADYAAGPNTVGVDYLLHAYSSSNSLTITRGTSATNWFLESSPVMGSGAAWTAVTNTAMLENGRYDVTVPISSAASYFRLHAPP